MGGAPSVDTPAPVLPVLVIRDELLRRRSCPQMPRHRCARWSVQMCHALHQRRTIDAFTQRVAEHKKVAAEAEACPRTLAGVHRAAVDLTIGASKAR